MAGLCSDCQENFMTPTALYIVRYCRFGNNIIQLFNALKLAREIGIKKVYLNTIAGSLLFTPNFRGITVLDNIEVLNEMPKSKTKFIKHQRPILTKEGILADRFFHAQSNGGYPFTQEYEDSPLIWGAIRKIMKIPPACISDDLYVHVRSGDVFTRPNPKLNYVQPPLSFYQKAILDQLERYSIKGIKIVFQNKHNFIIDPLIDWAKKLGKPVSICSNPDDAKADVRELLKARYSIIGKGSWMPIISCIAGKVKEISCFRALDGAFLFKNSKTNIRIYEDADGNYIHNWRIRPGNCPEAKVQIQQLLHYPIEQIRLKDEN